METGGAFCAGGKEGQPAYGQGYRWEGDDPDVLAAAVDAAFDYRGDVTLILGDGGEVHGYISNRDRSVPEPFIQVYPADGAAPLKIPYRTVRGIAFTGKDAASGKAWETWVQRYAAKKKARERGETVDDRGLFPEPMDGGK